jgi:hypothetical protein
MLCFCQVLIDNIKDFAPIIYTPTVGLVCENYGGLFRRSRGMYFSAKDKGEMMSMIYNWPQDKVKLKILSKKELLCLSVVVSQVYQWKLGLLVSVLAIRYEIKLQHEYGRKLVLLVWLLAYTSSNPILYIWVVVVSQSSVCYLIFNILPANF